MKISFFGLLTFALISGSHAAETICVSDTGTYTVKVNLFASQYGYFTFEECGDAINPTIGLKVGEEYTFSQADITNYYHPMGFAYEYDGALEDHEELEPIVKPPGSSSNCKDEETCPAPIYYVDGDKKGTFNNLVEPVVPDPDFGLDEYEPEFFYPIAEWASKSYEIKLKFTDSEIDQDIFYFCHIHAGMSGRIKILDDNEDPLVEADTPSIPYSYVAPTGLDAECGTSGINDFELPNSECPLEFVCLSGNESTELQSFAKCVDAMNCAMIVGMTSSDSDNKGALFSYQMIPHHVNAVNMAKALLTFGGFDCDDYTDEEDDDCRYEMLAREIITVQNFQIQAMEGVLAASGAGITDCAISAE